MRKKKIDNFKKWRAEQVRACKLVVNFKPLKRNGDLAELIGVVLGDGHIQKFPRTERLLIFSNANNPQFVARYEKIVREMFQKEPYVYRQSTQNCIRISLYQNCISERLGIPSGPRKGIDFVVPRWILSRREYAIRYLRGLYEAEGSVSIHLPTSTHKFSFSNTNQSLLDAVENLMNKFGFRTSRDAVRVQISRKAEVAQAVALIEFRKY